MATHCYRKDDAHHHQAFSFPSALGIIEILDGILNQVDSGATLVACACVSRIWHERAIKVIWRGRYPVGMLDRDPILSPSFETVKQLARKPQRWDHYMNNVRHLTWKLSEEQAFYPDSWPWSSCQLLSLNIHAYEGHIDTTAGSLTPLLRPGLRSVKVDHNRYPDCLPPPDAPFFIDCLLHAMNNLLPEQLSLRWLSLDLDNHFTEINTLFSVLQRQRSLCGLELRAGSACPKPDGFVANLASMPLLQHLKCNAFVIVPPDTSDHAGQGQVFPALRSLSIRTDGTVLPWIASHPLLQRVRLGYTNGCSANRDPKAVELSNALEIMQGMPSLEEVALSHSIARTCPNAALAAFAESSPQIRNIKIRQTGLFPETRSFPLNKGLLHLAQFCPQLEDLQILHPCDGDALFTIQTFLDCCPKLKRLCLQYKGFNIYSLRYLSTDSPSPGIRFFGIGSYCWRPKDNLLSNSTIPAASVSTDDLQPVVDVVKAVFPNLQKLHASIEENTRPSRELHAWFLKACVQSNEKVAEWDEGLVARLERKIVDG